MPALSVRPASFSLHKSGIHLAHSVSGLTVKHILLMKTMGSPMADSRKINGLPGQLYDASPAQGVYRAV